jgi:putative acetyltransferase
MKTTTRALPEGLTLRPLSEADAPQFHALHANPTVFHHGSIRLAVDTVESTREWIATFTPPSVAIVAVVSDTLVGCAELYAGRLRRAHSASLGISVHPAWHRRGIGSHLMAELLDVADNWLGLRRVELQLYADNAPALGLYRAHGFEIEARYRGHVLRDGVLVDTLLMGRLRDAMPFMDAAPRAAEIG